MSAAAAFPNTTAGSPRSVVLPLDVRLMNLSAAVIALLLLGLLLAAAAWAVQRAPALAIRQVQLQGDLLRTTPAAVRTQVLGAVAGNFFAADLGAAQRAFKELPWVRRAVVRRVWPHTLVVVIEEHEPVALWQRLEDGEASTANNTPERLVNRQGEVFEANLGDVAAEQLPTLTGPEGRAAEMLALFGRLQPVFGDAGMVVQSLHLSGRGSWRADLDSGATVELGRGSADEVIARTRNFAQTLKAARTQYFAGAALESADLRHGNGYALRLAGVATGGAASGSAAHKQR